MRPKPPYEKIGPGLFIDGNGTAVVNVADLLRDLELEDTADNRQYAFNTILELLRQEMPSWRVFARPPGDQKWRREK